MKNTYTINQVEVLSGIKSHTLRIWEKRYGIIEPKRTETNIRYFTEEDLKKILNISYLNKAGIKISKIAKMDEDEISAEVIVNYQSTNNTEEIVEALCIDVFNYDLYSFKEKTTNYLAINSFEKLIEKIIYPLFDRIGIMWQTNLIIPAQEHLFSNYIRQLVCAEINDLKVKPKKEKVLLFLRENEYHELGLLIYHFFISKKGYEVVYLGQSVPFRDLKCVIDKINPPIIITSFLAYLEVDSFNQYIKELEEISLKSNLYLSGNTVFVNENKNNHKYKVIHGIEELNEMF